MAFVQTTDKWLATHAFINTWLKDPTLYCNNCGDVYVPCCAKTQPVITKITKSITKDGKESIEDRYVYKCKNCCAEMYICCDNPQVADNKTHTYALIQQNKDIQKSRLHSTAANKTKTMRLGVSLPPALYDALEKYFKETLNEKLFDNKIELREFMKRFPQFTIPERI